VIRAVSPLGLLLLAGCAGNPPSPGIGWTAAPSVIVSSGSGDAELLDVDVDDAATQAPDAAGSSGGVEAGPNRGVAPRSLLLADEPPALVSRGGQPAMIWPARPHHKRRPGRPYHPDPRVVIDVTRSGGAVATELQRTARDAGYWPFRRCYEDGLRRDQELSGKVSLVLAGSPGGQVEDAPAAGTTFQDKIVVACVKREARHLPLPPSESDAGATMDVTFGAGDEPVAVPLPAGRGLGLRGALEGVWPEARQCYSRALAVDPNVGGRIEILFHVDVHGEVTEVSGSGSQVAGSGLATCLIEAYRAAHLAFPEGSGPRRFVYALHLETDATPSARERP
jgi:hypothetical protein